MAGKNMKAYDDQLNPEGVRGKTPKASDESDVEGHTRGKTPKAHGDEIAPEGVRGKTPKATDDDDVEGHIGGSKVK